MSTPSIAERVAAGDIDLEAIRTRAEAATKGPWTIGERRVRGVDDWRLPILNHFEGEDGPDTDQVAVVTYTTGGFQFPHADARSDAEFIAHAREDIPALLAEIDSLRAELDERNAEEIDRAFDAQERRQAAGEAS